MTYAIYHGNLDIANLLFKQKTSNTENSIKPAAPINLFNRHIEIGNIGLDDIPSLSLPPPMMPFRIYGHSYLNGKRQLSIHFSSTDSVKLFSTTCQQKSHKLIVTSNLEQGLPFSRILPFAEDQEPLTFTLDDFSNFSLYIEILPTFGSHYIAKGVILYEQIENALKNNISGSHYIERFVCALLDSHLRCVGQLNIGVSIVTPFAHPLLSIGGKTETYWKATQPLINSRENHSSFITASSLSEEYIELTVQFTKDHQVVVYPENCILHDGLLICISSLTLDQCRTILSKQLKETFVNSQAMTAKEYVKILYRSLMTLNEAIQVTFSSHLRRCLLLLEFLFYCLIRLHGLLKIISAQRLDMGPV